MFSSCRLTVTEVRLLHWGSVDVLNRSHYTGPSTSRPGRGWEAWNRHNWLTAGLIKQLTVCALTNLTTVTASCQTGDPSVATAASKTSFTARDCWHVLLQSAGMSITSLLWSWCVCWLCVDGLQDTRLSITENALTAKCSQCELQF